ncbi:hypothetical protein AMAG_06448 [Allomyces macrogynus ATCC 38327]|uniref:DH domain-containing protein n=1 Tax=Allomyces macrogynus (strain ATCC 38327) TaxID=578462 RepID=A0A0L0SGJ7_ALLM3|nr:hypothetical protein AMAG_06448 [Allomyces macrogynus ATCC 38327]|eukprot:KNE61638.1 hypothetical protein AMAG_06448 [Allomyces macrogynus ATCC 38327]
MASLPVISTADDDACPMPLAGTRAGSVRTHPRRPGHVAGRINAAARLSILTTQSAPSSTVNSPRDPDIGRVPSRGAVTPSPRVFQAVLAMPPLPVATATLDPMPGEVASPSAPLLAPASSRTRPSLATLTTLTTSPGDLPQAQRPTHGNGGNVANRSAVAVPMPVPPRSDHATFSPDVQLQLQLQQEHQQKKVLPRSSCLTTDRTPAPSNGPLALPLPPPRPRLSAKDSSLDSAVPVRPVAMRTPPGRSLPISAPSPWQSPSVPCRASALYTESDLPEAIRVLPTATVTASRWRRRIFVMRELTETETAYAEDLMLLEQIYIAPLSDRIPGLRGFRLLSRGTPPPLPSKLGRLLVAARPVLAVACDLARRLQRELDQLLQIQGDVANLDSAESRIGDLFLDVVPQLQAAYMDYCLLASAGLMSAQQVETKDHQLLSFRDTLAANSANWDLPCLLIKPVQRILKYPLFLQQLLDVTLDTEPDHVALKAALVLFEEAAREINLACRSGTRNGSSSKAHPGTPRGGFRRLTINTTALSSFPGSPMLSPTSPTWARDDGTSSPTSFSSYLSSKIGNLARRISNTKLNLATGTTTPVRTPVMSPMASGFADSLPVTAE